VQEFRKYAENRRFSRRYPPFDVWERRLAGRRIKRAKALWRKNDNVDILVDLVGTFGDVGLKR
jgi:hypothetical protein